MSPLVLEQKIPDVLEIEKNNICVVGLFADPERLSEIRGQEQMLIKPLI